MKKAIITIILMLAIFGGVGVSAVQTIDCGSTELKNSAQCQAMAKLATTAKDKAQMQEGDLVKTIGSAINLLLSVLSVVFLIIVVYGGVIWMTASGDPEQVKKARNSIIHGAIGMIVCLSAWSLSMFIVNQMINAGIVEANVLRATQGTVGEAIQPGSTATEDGLVLLIGKTLRAVIGFLGIAIIIIIVYAGYLWSTAGGSEEQVTKAKKWVVSGVIGLILASTTFFLTDYVVEKLSVSVLPQEEAPPAPPG